jgi:hypothetical protein
MQKQKGVFTDKSGKENLILFAAGAFLVFHFSFRRFRFFIHGMDWRSWPQSTCILKVLGFACLVIAGIVLYRGNKYSNANVGTYLGAFALTALGIWAALGFRILMVYLATISFTICFVIYSKFQFQEREGKSHGKWHPWGWMMRAIFVASLLIRPAVDDIILSAAISILLFELLINKVALNVRWFHVGTTAWWDRKIGKKNGGSCQRCW